MSSWIPCATLIIALSAGAAHAALVPIEFTGQLRRGTTDQASPTVEGELQTRLDGRTVRVRLEVEDLTADSDPVANQAMYRGAVRSASLSVSGVALPMAVLSSGEPYCGAAPLLDCSIRVTDNRLLGTNPLLGTSLLLDELVMRSPSFELLGGALLGGLLPVLDIFFANSLAGNAPALVQGTDLQSALNTMLSQPDAWHIRLLGVGAGCTQNCYSANWAIDGLTFGAAAAVPAPPTALLTVAALAVMGWRRSRRQPV